ncbi:MAG: SDR family NAD(P)-dependent oxidoreductase [Candidatus Omnitrophica bacterium]|nr:SDR family NAD(P)-dependent oxidoreductase [Candidatus Omnitrophota bacterium]
MSWHGKRVLVTGAGGFIGSHLAEKLTAAGAKTRALVHYRSDGSWGWLDRSPMKEQIEIVAGDVRDAESVQQAMQGIDIAFHLAALIGIPYSYHAPSSYIHTNVEGTLHVLQAARTHGIERVVHTSTSEVYGTARYVPIDEAHPLHAQSPYAASKIGADALAESFAHAFGLPVVIVRPFNTFGPRQSARAVIPTIMTQCLTDGVIRLGHLHPTRDLNYVDNTVEGYLRAAEAPAAIGRTINLGSGREISIGDLAAVIAGLADRPIRIEEDESRLRPPQSEVDRLLAKNALAREVLGWEPSITLEEGLRITMAWMREHLDGYRAGLYAI